jgi:shikimate kinase
MDNKLSIQTQSLSRLVLIGFRGAGKSTLAAELASRLNLGCISTDANVERRTGRSIAAFVQQHGWEKFRRMEHEVIAALPTERVLVDCGGGVIENPDNMRLLQERSLIVWVDAEVEDIISRLATPENAHRPLLSGASMVEDIRTNYARRKPLYEQWCGLYVNTSHSTLENITTQISKQFSNCNVPLSTELL